MGITVRSPHDGELVKVRDEDVGRAVRDKAGRIFYVLPRSDGKGHYGAPTRASGQKDEQRAIQMEERMGKAQDHARAQLDAVHDATGKRRNSSRGKLVILFFVIVIGSLAGYAVYLVTTGQVPWQNPVAATTDTGLKYEILKPGHGDPAVTGQTVTLHYKGSLLADGSVFDDSFARGQPITIKLGVDRMIAGFTQGVIGMKVGELRRLTIPPNLAYGNRAQPNIPANATLVFEVELLSID